jgi:stringent starvation protein B
MLSSRPYLVEAIFEWIVDNGQTPFMMVDATIEGVCVPSKHIVDDEIVLNLSPSAISHFVMNKEYIQFKARFSGKVEQIFVPLFAVKALYAQENMSGIGFTPEGAPYFAGDLTGDPVELDDASHLQDVSDHAAKPADKPSKPSKKGPPHLTLV